MAGHGGRLQSSVNGSLDEPGFVLPLSSNHLNGLRGFLTSLSPFVSRSSGRTLSVYARRLIAENGNSRTTVSTHAPHVGERHHHRSNILGVWSNSNSQLSRRLDLPEEDLTNNFTSPPQQEAENVVINIDSISPTREPHRRPSSPLLQSRVNDLPVAFEETPSATDSGPASTAAAGAASNESSNNAENTQGTDGGIALSVNGESLTEILERHPELKQVLKVAWQYFLFVLIILIKTVYDSFSSLLIIILFFIGFAISNKIVKISVSHQERRSKRLTLALLVVLTSIPLGIYLFYHRTPDVSYDNALFLRSEKSFLNLGELLWIVIVTDFIIKLSTVFIKGVFSLIPCWLLHHKHRGEHLALIEITSQLYRSLATMEPWVTYLLGNYTGFERGFGILLTVMYIMCKGQIILHRANTLFFALKRFMERSRYGSTPSTAQIKEMGGACPICQDAFEDPTMLQCKHIFCEQCVAKWFDRERTCPMCRTKVADDPSYRDGSTSYSIQLY